MFFRSISALILLTISLSLYGKETVSCQTFNEDYPLVRAFTVIGNHFSADTPTTKFTISRASGFMIMKMTTEYQKAYVLFSDKAVSVCKVWDKDNYLAVLKYGRNNHPYQANHVMFLEWDKNSEQFQDNTIQFFQVDNESGYTQVSSIRLIMYSDQGGARGRHMVTTRYFNKKGILARKEFKSHTASLSPGDSELLIHNKRNFQRKGKDKYLLTTENSKGEKKSFEIKTEEKLVSHNDFFLSQVLLKREFPSNKSNIFETLVIGAEVAPKIKARKMEYSANSFTVITKDSDNKMIQEIRFNQDFKLESINNLESNKKLIQK